MRVSLNEAVKLTGVDRRELARRISRGELTLYKDGIEVWQLKKYFSISVDDPPPPPQERSSSKPPPPQTWEPSPAEWAQLVKLDDRGRAEAIAVLRKKHPGVDAYVRTHPLPPVYVKPEPPAPSPPPVPDYIVTPQPTPEWRVHPTPPSAPRAPAPPPPPFTPRPDPSLMRHQGDRRTAWAVLIAVSVGGAFYVWTHRPQEPVVFPLQSDPAPTVATAQLHRHPKGRRPHRHATATREAMVAAGTGADQDTEPSGPSNGRDAYSSETATAEPNPSYATADAAPPGQQDLGSIAKVYDPAAHRLVVPRPTLAPASDGGADQAADRPGSQP